MFVKFYYKPTESGFGEDGLPLYEDRIWVIIARDSTHKMDRVAKDEDFKRFQPIYDAFVRENAEYSELEGFPLEMWSALKPSQVATLKAREIRTVQELAKSPPAKMPSEYRELKSLADKFIKLAGMGTGLTRKAEALAAELETAKEDLKAARERIKVLEKKAA